MVDFQAGDHLELQKDRARRELKKKDRTPDRRLGRRKLQLKRKFCLVFQHSLLTNFPFHALFFGMSSVLA